jgi:Cu/Ag efflux protein CusF
MPVTKKVAATKVAAKPKPVYREQDEDDAVDEAEAQYEGEATETEADFETGSVVQIADLVATKITISHAEVVSHKQYMTSRTELTMEFDVPEGLDFLDYTKTASNAVTALVLEALGLSGTLSDSGNLLLDPASLPTPAEAPKGGATGGSGGRKFGPGGGGGKPPHKPSGGQGGGSQGDTLWASDSDWSDVAEAILLAVGAAQHDQDAPAGPASWLRTKHRPG